MASGLGCLLLLASLGALASPVPEGAKVEGNVYTNTALGFSFHFPNGWVVRKIEPSGASGARALLLRVTPPNSDNPLLFVWWQDLKDAFLIKDERDWLAVHRYDMKSKGFEPRKDARAVSYGNLTFYRIDFQSRRARNRTYQATVVTIRERKLIGFGVAGASEKEVEDVLKSLDTVEFR